MKLTFVLHTDGASKGNPGPSSYGAVLYCPDGRELHFYKRLGLTTSNVAEYHGLLAGLQAAADENVEHLEVRMDSKLVVDHMTGRAKVRAPHLKPLFRRACDLCLCFISVTFQHVPRTENKTADRLANLAFEEDPYGTP